MTTFAPRESTSEALRVQPSPALLAAALAGLVGITAGACNGDDSPEPNSGDRPMGGSSGDGDGDQNGDGDGDGDSDSASTGGQGGAPGAEEYNIVLSEEAVLEDLLVLCEERKGWTYVTAYCSGSGQCKGLFLLGSTLTDHSCKGLNGCGGVGCVDMPEDAGLTGRQIFEEGGCTNCHGKWNEDYSEVDLSVYTLVHPDTLTSEEALRNFENSTLERLTSIVVFGTQGIHPDGSYYSNMPSYRDKYSLPEIQRAIAHIRNLTHETASYAVPMPASSMGGAGGDGDGDGDGDAHH